MPKSLPYNPCKPFSFTHFTHKNTHTKAFFRKSNHHAQKHTKTTSTKTTKIIDNHIRKFRQTTKLLFGFINAQSKKNKKNSEKSGPLRTITRRGGWGYGFSWRIHKKGDGGGGLYGSRIHKTAQFAYKTYHFPQIWSKKRPKKAEKRSPLLDSGETDRGSEVWQMEGRRKAARLVGGRKKTKDFALTFVRARIVSKP